MNRLRDERGDGPVAMKGIELIRRTPGAAPSQYMKRRIWLALQEPEPRPVRRPVLRGARSLAVAAVTIGIGGTAGAMIAHGWIRSSRRTAARTPPPAVARHAVAPAAPRPAAVAIEEAPPLPPEEAPPQRTRPRPEPRRRLTARAPVVVATAPGPTAAERTQVLDAMIALRRDHDPVRAARMLDRYLAAHPRGSLREEALVLDIEAAMARGDGAAVRNLAAAYGDAYPGGRFAQYARDALTSAP